MQVDNQLIADIARQAVAKSAPQELPLFRGLSAAYFDDPAKAVRAHAGKDEMLGFGAGDAAAFITPAALAVATAVVQFVFTQVVSAVKNESASLIAKYTRKLFGLAVDDGAALKPLNFDADQLARVRGLALEKARQLNLPDAQAALLADALCGSLAAAGK